MLAWAGWLRRFHPTEDCRMRNFRAILSLIAALSLAFAGLSPAQAAPNATKKGDLVFAKNAKVLTAAMKRTADGWADSFGEMDTVTITSYVPQGSKSTTDIKLGNSRNAALKEYLVGQEVTSEFRVAVVRVKAKDKLANITRVMHTDRPDFELHKVAFNVVINGAVDCDLYGGTVKVANLGTLQVTSHFVAFTQTESGCAASVELVDILEGSYQPGFDIWVAADELYLYLDTPGWYAGAGGPGMIGFATEEPVQIDSDQAFSLNFVFPV